MKHDAICTQHTCLKLHLVDNENHNKSTVAIHCNPLGKSNLALIFKGTVQPLVLETINDPRLSAERLLVPGVAAVLVGFDGNFQYWNLLLAASYLADEEVGLWICGSSDSPFKVLFVATNTDENFLRAGLVIPGFD